VLAGFALLQIADRFPDCWKVSKTQHGRFSEEICCGGFSNRGLGILDRLLSEIPTAYWSIDDIMETEESLYVGTPPPFGNINLKAGMIVPEDPES